MNDTLKEILARRARRAAAGEPAADTSRQAVTAANLHEQVKAEAGGSPESAPRAAGASLAEARETRAEAKPEDLVAAAIRRINRHLAEGGASASSSERTSARENLDATWRRLDAGEASPADLHRAIDAWERAWGVL